MSWNIERDKWFLIWPVDYSLRYLAEDVKKIDENLAVMRKRKQIRRIEKQIVPRRIGKNKFQEEDIDVNMPTDIAGNLRNLKMEGSILTTTFKNMQRRNILAPTVDIGLRRRKEIKRFVRNSHKIDHDQRQVQKNLIGSKAKKQWQL